jgi:hypothetical protein
MKHTRYLLSALAALLFLPSAFAAEKVAAEIPPKDRGIGKDSGIENDAPLTNPSAAWANSSYRKDIPATQAQSRPVSTGWKLWMKHHEQRKSWVKNRKVDLLMVGDSIVFRWGRTGKKRNNKIIRTYADNKVVYWLDINDTFLDDNGMLIKELMPDGLHPNEKGFRAWAEAMEPTIEKLLGE